MLSNVARTAARYAGRAWKPLLVVILLVWPVAGSSYSLSVMTSAGLYALLAIAVLIILGQAGQLSFGHSAFYGIGAYTAALLAVKAGWPTWLGLLAGGAVSGVVALAIGRPVLRLRYFYLALATIGLGQIFLVMITQLRGVTGGSLGLAPIPAFSAFGFHFDSYLRAYYLVWVIALVVLLFVTRALKYRMGRALRAVASSETASKTLGVRTSDWKLLAFTTSAVICGVAGGLFAFTASAISPGAFTFSAAILPLVMVLLGGLGSTWGAAIGAIVMTWVVYGFTGIQEYSGIAYSVIMIGLLIFFPLGLALRPAQREKLKALVLNRTVLTSATMVSSTAPNAESVMAQAGESAAGPAVDQSASEVPGEVLLDIEGLSVRFGGLAAVDDVSLTVREAQIVALIGPNGAGKTTLFNAVCRLQKAGRGTINFAGRDVTRMSPTETARLGMARTFQNLRIYPNMDVLENVLVGCHRHERSGLWSGGLGLPWQRREERASRERAVKCLELLGLADKAAIPAASLPYGQQRLVEMARAMASEPRLLLLDEPAAGMNKAERAELVEQIARIRRSGIAVLLVEHDVELVMGISDHIYVLDYGRLIFDGRPEHACRDAGVIEAYVGVERQGSPDICLTRDRTGTDCEPVQPLLAVEGLDVAYGAIRALHGVDLSVPEGEIVAVLGANGAGKSTLLRAVGGLLKPSDGLISYRGRNIAGLSAQKVAAMGVRQVLEGRHVFPEMSVQDNLVVGSSAVSGWRSTLADDVAYVYELFPVLGERRKQPAGTLSGGEQQMLAIGRALVGRPELLLLDEPSMGLAPLAVEKIFECLARLNKQGLTMLMVEQNAELALALAHRAIVLQNGRVARAGTSGVLRADDSIREGYLGKALGLP
jgi:ABC-type branched-subunit amino acid transport system ATPase component/ABC-type branched-subunit amino acid transport system permease subunit